ncbi:MAG: DUF5615 family PIN-like protein [Caldilineaceae bacterium]|nr:DUF5615 family PIN-like protein [Caldilineaceae bacterium]
MSSCWGWEERSAWTYARRHDYMIVSKDADFGDLLLLHGFPPKVIWIRRSNCSTQDIEALLRDLFEAIERLNDEPDTGILARY